MLFEPKHDDVVVCDMVCSIDTCPTNGVHARVTNALEVMSTNALQPLSCAVHMMARRAMVMID